MAKNSIQAGIGTRRVFGDARLHSDYVHSGSPFETLIGVGKVIKGWDDGELLSIRLISPYYDSHPLPPLCSTYAGVPQLSLGEKAKLIVTPDCVSSDLCLVRHTAGGSSAFSPNRRTVLVDSRRSFHPTPLSSSKSSSSLSINAAGNRDALRILCANLFARDMDSVLSVLRSCIACDFLIFIQRKRPRLCPNPVSAW